MIAPKRPPWSTDADADNDTHTKTDTDTDTDTDADTDTDTGADMETDIGTDSHTNIPLHCEGTIEFADPKLEGAVRNAIGKPDGEIYSDDVNDLSVLWAGQTGIYDLTGIECLTSLTELLIFLNRISDITALSGLLNLTDLNLYKNSISDITALSGLSSLNVLDLTSNSIDDITALSAGLPYLDLLGLSYNSIRDIAPLVENARVDEGDYVYIKENLLDCDDPTTQANIATLEGRGVILEHDCI